jgi:hypothetical protein
VILGINGILTTGGQSTDLLLRRLDILGHETYDVPIPIRTAFTSRSSRIRARDVQRVLIAAKDGDTLIAHSRGCLVAAECMKYRKFETVWMFRPAMSTRYKFPAGDINVKCVYSKGDWAILIGGLLLHHRFGMAGRSGFKDPRIENIKAHGGHSADFKRIHYWAEMVDKECKKY